ncbi:MAG TPA: carbamoyltransferase HypF [Candidatus Marinimicrobia bacterium]|nr:carbamoyltransferase HypF [Candidatus Neomarinimicrobiota bacterium]HRS51614.1 carbamoyltransferase HypF [Candidatus Neomarinimicrobiota bacterium]HRU92308.1 carbamoyltransferase HypF [Candidatus Neomarinimicrobiota bacterium]
MISHKIIITGIVQGVGFRPFIYNLARQYQLTGWVRNNSSGVEIVAQGEPRQLTYFEEKIRNSPPPRCRIEQFEVAQFIAAEKFLEFKIVESQNEPTKSVQVSPDLDICPDCQREMFDSFNRRYLYPFINCTNCGPRFTIIQDVPYDRSMTAMCEFKMCLECQREYDDPSNRRFHAQPNACPVCGPRLQLLDSSGRELLTGGDAGANRSVFEKVAELLHDGRIIAVKGVGGFHLACDARNEAAVVTLRQRKYREDKPFAVMFPSLSEIALYCKCSREEEHLLNSVPHPIVLLRKLPGQDVAAAVAPGNHYLGCFLPYSPLHYLLMYFFPYPLVLTSGNISDEPIAYQDDDALARLNRIADYFLTHNRKIHIRCDDSVYRVWNNKPYPLRRSRGFAPGVVPYKNGFIRPILACGPEQKNTFALAQSNHVYLSQHIGDLVNFEVLKSLKNGINHFKNIFAIEPEVVAYDLHPDYLSTKFALEYPDETPDGRRVEKIGVQHHHAHAVACLAENDVAEPAIGIILDGTGYGTDGTIWGGEILKVEMHRFERIGHFRPARLPGGSAAIKYPWQMAVSYLYETLGSEISSQKFPFLESVPPEQIDIVINMLKSGFNSPLTTSCGRLFDGVAALAGLRNQVNYEGQAAVEFEQCIEDGNDRPTYDFEIETGTNRFAIDWRKMIEEVIMDVKHQTGIGLIATKFHNGLANILLQAALKAREMTGLRTVALSGGVFMNVYLLTRLSQLLNEHDFKVRTHRLVPCNDGGIALGQTVIANAIIQNQLEKL